MVERSDASHHAHYFAVFCALCVLTLASVAFDLIHLDNRILLAFLVLAVATAKALFVMGYFMHLKFEGNWKFLLLSPTIVLAMGIPLAIAPDVSLHYYTVVAPQQKYVEAARDEAKDEAAEPANQPESTH